MPTVDVVDLHSKKVGTVDLPQAVFGCEPRVSLVHEAVVMQRACERQGTSSTLRRSEVSGSGKKPWKQKHTGRARAGSLRSPVWRHGGIVFGPKPRDYSYTMPKKKYRAALQSALSAKLADGKVIVVSEFSLAQPKTKLLAKALDQFGLGETALVVAGEYWLNVHGQTTHYKAGDRFQVARDVEHAETYGPAGAVFWAARKNAPAA